jgi:hypothetical protein
VPHNEPGIQSDDALWFAVVGGVCSRFTTGAGYGTEAALKAETSTDTAVSLGKGQLVNDNVRAFMKGKKALKDLTKDEIDSAIKGYQNAANTAKTPLQKAYQEARIKALQGKGPSPGSLSDFAKQYNCGGS